MKTPTDWLMAAGLMVVLYFVILLADNIWLKGRGAARRFWKRHIVADFPYPGICWNCRLSTCAGCTLIARNSADIPKVRTSD